AINVKELPSPPAGFKGAVGHFSLTSTMDKNNIKSNEAITIKTKISGSGNLKHITPINFSFPADFEVYDPKTEYNFKASESGISGSTDFEQVVIPRFAGDFTIPSENFVYFDPSTQSYKTLSTEEFRIHVEKGSDEQNKTVVSSMSKQDVKYLGKDIHFIKNQGSKLKPKNSFFFGSFMFFLTYLAAMLAFAFLVFFQQKKIRENADIALMRNRKASKIASERLKAAANCVKTNNKEEFFDSVMRAFWGYLSDKLTLPVSELNRDNARATLTRFNVDGSTIEEFMSLIDTCEMARFAPTAVNEPINELYVKAENLMSSLEKQIRKKA
ncbi:MAG TPA: BatD family protein, partial [Prolixibacteraceae bacterium]|nr:BatD family protein [Prolixibacteraceae bacterium]